MAWKNSKGNSGSTGKGSSTQSKKAAEKSRILGLTKDLAKINKGLENKNSQVYETYHSVGQSSKPKKPLF